MNVSHLAVLLSILIPLKGSAQVTPQSCLDINRSVGISMTNTMVKDFGIQESDISLEKTALTLLSIEKVTSKMAEYYAHQSYQSEPEHYFPEEEYKEIYLQSNSKNIIVKYDYTSKLNKHNVLYASLLVNDDECSIRFNSYIIAKREF